LRVARRGHARYCDRYSRLKSSSLACAAGGAVAYAPPAAADHRNGTIRRTAMINAVVDTSSYQATVDFTQIRAAGILGVIHKATQGLADVDARYAERRTRAVNAGLLWGAYHFGTGDDAGKQAEHFLDAVESTGGGDAAHDLLVLDLEANPTPGETTMTLAGAESFVEAIARRTGRWPGLYSGALVKEYLGSQGSATLARCWFWLAEYGDVAHVPAGWSRWTMWQYTNGTLGPGPHVVDGVGPCDRDRFNGTAEQLRAFWPGKHFDRSAP
jgi:lysozyme